MSRTIYKYEIDTTDTQQVKMPEGAQILTVQVQNGKPCLWALVDNEMPKKAKLIEVFGTGHPMPAGQRAYIGTYQLNHGLHVFHVFERL